jgi:hypothetical protein
MPRYQTDIDSLLFTTTNPVALTDVKLVLLPNFFSILSKNNHLKYPVKRVFMQANGQEIERNVLVGLYKIPNFEFATTGNNEVFHLHIFFPNLCERIPNTKNLWRTFMTSEEYSTFYALVIEALQISCSDFLNQSVPFSYEAIDKNSKTQTGKYFYQSLHLSSVVFNNMIKNLKEIVVSKADPKFQNFFFHIHAKDLKNIWQDASNGLQQIETIYKCFQWEESAIDFYVDVGVEILPPSDSGLTYIWNSNFTKSYLEFMGSRAATHFPYCLLHDAGNTVGEVKNENICYLQTYMCDKRILSTYGNQGCIAFSQDDVLKCNSRFNTRVNDLQYILEKASEASKPYGLRMEYRVKYSYALHLLSLIQKQMPSFLNSSRFFYAIPTDFISEFKILVARGMQKIAYLSSINNLSASCSKEDIARYIEIIIKGLVAAPHPSSTSSFLKRFNVFEQMKQHNFAVLDISFNNIKNIISKNILISFNSTPSWKLKNPPLIENSASSKLQVMVKTLTAKQMLNIILASIWNVLPKDKLVSDTRPFLPDNQDGLTFSEDGFPPFTLNSFEKVFQTGVIGFVKVVRKRELFASMFEIFCPYHKIENFQDIHYFKQLSYINIYNIWIDQSLEIKQQLHSMLKKEFMKLEVFPRSNLKDKVWCFIHKGNKILKLSESRKYSIERCLGNELMIIQNYKVSTPVTAGMSIFEGSILEEQSNIFQNTITQIKRKVIEVNSDSDSNYDSEEETKKRPPKRRGRKQKVKRGGNKKK